MNENKKRGNCFEGELCERLFRCGYWAHNMAANASGQPADVIAVKNGNAYLIDCKVCSNGKFLFSRMEENQDLSMGLWESCGNGQGWFALLVENFIYMIPHSVIRIFRQKQSGFNKHEIQSVGIPFDTWVSYNRPTESTGEK